MSSLSTADAKFGLDTFKVLLKENADQNIFFSPVSVLGALAMVCYGARGDTAAQMGKVLHFSDAQSAETSASGDSSATRPQQPCNTATDSQCDRPGGIHSQFQALLSQLSKPTEKYDLSLANRLYGATDFEFLPHYLHCLKELYHARLESVDFEKATQKTREQINSWVESQTHGKIKDFFPTGGLDPSSVLVLVSAIYFQGTWLFPFQKKNTKEAPFWMNKNESKNVPMMVQTGIFRYASIEDPPLQVLELPYDGKELSMIILLPKDTGDDNFSFEKLARSFSYEKIEEWTSSSNMHSNSVAVKLPKFKLEESYDLKTTLESMGMTLVFDNSKADLSGMSKKQGLFVSKVIHKSFVDVNEEGTEAAAGTGVSIIAGDPQIPVEFSANHPFVFVIKHNAHNTILFIGKYSTP